MDQTDAFSAFAELLARDDDEIEIDRAALLFAAAEYPDLDIEAALTTLDEFAERLGRRVVGLQRAVAAGARRRRVPARRAWVQRQR